MAFIYSLGLIGYPLEHSLSPQLHHAALRALKRRGLAIEGEYRLYPIPPLPDGAEELSILLSRVRSGEIHGLNATIPHKQNLISYLDELTPAASIVGAVNTIYLQHDRLSGDNTDIPGFLTDLKEVIEIHRDQQSVKAPHALVLGAGGSALAVTYALLTIEMNVTIAARRLEQARSLVDRFETLGQHDRIRAICLDSASVEALNSNLDLIVNTTPVGMWPHVDFSPWPSGIPFPPQAILYDLVYNPPQTKLARQAQSQGLEVRTGLGMLVEQAALALERWTGYDVSREAMWQAIPPALLPTSGQKGIS